MSRKETWGAPVHMRCCEAVADRRLIRSSNGAEERRFMIRAALRLGVYECEAELSLADRGAMEFPLLVGRDALGDRFVIDPAASFILDDIA